MARPTICQDRLLEGDAREIISEPFQMVADDLRAAIADQEDDPACGKIGRYHLRPQIKKIERSVYPGSSVPDGHDHAEEAFQRLEDPGADFILQLEEDLVLRQRPKRIHEKRRIESDLQIGTAIVDRERLMGFSKVRTRRAELH